MAEQVHAGFANIEHVPAPIGLPPYFPTGSHDFRAIIHRIEGFRSRSSRASLQCQVIHRSLEDDASSTACSSETIIPGKDGSARLQYSITLGDDSISAIPSALLLELSVDGDRVAWVIFPLSPHSIGGHRLRMNRAPRDPRISLVRNLIVSKSVIVQADWYISFSISLDPATGTYRSIQKEETLPSSSMYRLQRSDSDSSLPPLDIFRSIPSPIKTTSCQIARFDPESCLLALGVGCDVFIYDFNEDDFSAVLNHTCSVCALAWKNGEVFCSFADRRCRIWNILTGETSDLELEGTANHLHAHEGCMVACMDGMCILIHRSGPLGSVHDDRLFDCVGVTVAQEGQILVVTRSRLLELCLSDEGMRLTSDIPLEFDCMVFNNGILSDSAGRISSIRQYSAGYEVVTVCQLASCASCLAVSPDRILVAIGYMNGRVEIRNCASGLLVGICNLTLPVPAACMSWSSTHHVLAVAGKADPGSSLPVVLLSSTQHEGRAGHDWRRDWLSRDHPASVLPRDEVFELKSRILQQLISSAD